MSKRILFVDDEPNVLQGLRRMLRSQRHEWDMVFANSGREALDMLAGGVFDVIVSDMRMPEMDGSQLLQQMMRRSPQTVRMILSGHADHDAILRSVGVAHRFLAKPSSAEQIKDTIKSALELRELLGKDCLRQLVSKMETLPSLPALYQKVMEQIQSPMGSFEHVGKLIAHDVGMTAKLLQLVNSAYFGAGRPISCPIEAVGLLGFDMVRELILSYHVFCCFDQSALHTLSLEELWEHSWTVGLCASAIARSTECSQAVVDEAFVAGLLHDAGLLLFAANLPQAYEEMLDLAQEPGVGLWQAERQRFGATHAEVGAYLLGLWGLPDTIVEAVALHHEPAKSVGRTFTPLTAVHVANAFLDGTDIADTAAICRVLEREYLQALGVNECLTAWKTCCQEVLLHESTATVGQG